MWGNIMTMRILSAAAVATVALFLGGCQTSGGARSVDGTNIGTLSMQETTLAASNYVIPETAAIRVTTVEKGSWGDGRSTEHVKLNRGLLMIESVGGDYYFRPFPENRVIPTADAVMAKAPQTRALKREGSGQDYGFTWVTYGGGPQACVFAMGPFGASVGPGKQHSARLVLCGDAPATPTAVKDEGLAFLRGVRAR